MWRALLANCAEREEGLAFHEVLPVCFAPPLPPARPGPGPELFVWSVERACPSWCHHSVCGL